MRRNALDLCCKAGGSGRGLTQAGFNVVGIDSQYQPRHPHDMEFEQMDFRDLNPRWVRRNFDFIWASPPCQKFTALKSMKSHKRDHPNLIPAARSLIQDAGLPAVIENVVGAPLKNPIMLTGTMFGLGVTYNRTWFQLVRERLFECHNGFTFKAPKDRYVDFQPVIGVYGGHARNRSKEWGGRGTVDFEGASQKELASKAMGINWMTLAELSEAIPPAYSKHIGEAALTYIGD